MDRRTFIAATGLLSTGLVAGCLGGGGGNGGGGQATPTASPTPSPTPSPSPGTAETPSGATSGQEAYPDYNWEVLEGETGELTTQITLRDTQFHPLVAEVPRGTEVTFTNEDSFPHTVTIPALEVDERLDGGASTTMTFDTLETYDYVCKLHPPSMLGRLVVVEETPTASPTPTEGGGGATPTPTPTETDDGGYY